MVPEKLVSRMLVVGWVALGCGDPGQMNSTDSGVQLDAGMSTISDGGQRVDAGMRTSDAGMADGGSPWAVLTGPLAFEVKSAWSYVRELSDGGPDFTRGDVILLSESLFCPNLQERANRDMHVLGFQVFQNIPGTLERRFDAREQGARVQFNRFTASQTSPEEVASVASGTFTFNSFALTGAQGDFSLVFTRDAGMLNGTFNAPFCGSY